MTFLVLLGLLAPPAGVPSGAQEAPSVTPSVTLEGLLDELVDRDRIARWPEPAFRSRQASSHDRRSVAPDQPGWFANMDRSWFVRTLERDGRRERVMMEAEGPGAIVRFWGTWHGPKGGDFTNGTLRVYLDGSEEPAIEGPIVDVVSGGALVAPPLSQFVSPDCPPANRAHNLYLPIPYADGCLVTYETDAPMDDGAYEGEALYYQIGYREYAPGTRVESFTLEGLAALGERVQAVNRALARRAYDLDSAGGHVSLPVEVAAGSSRTLEFQGSQAVRRIVARLVAEDEVQALRSTVLEIECDGERTVWCPLDAFFGCGYLARPYDSWYTARSESGTMEARWLMPFEEGMRITLHNLGEQDVEVHGRVEFSDWRWDERSMHFRADWRRYAELEAPGAVWDQEGCSDLEFLSARGRGVLVGDNLSVFNTVDAWWGEGDEKLWVDGEAFPSTFGTGTEDYYGYAWCRPEPFSSPFHAQPTGEGNFHPGYTVNLRQRLLDTVPFERSLRFDMELEHWVACTIDYTPAVFWYARPGAEDDTPPDPVQAAAPVPREKRDIVPPVLVEGALEGEAFEVRSVTGGTVEVQEVSQFRWSDDRQLWWRDGSKGDVLELVFLSDEAGTLPVEAELTLAVDYGVVALTINDIPAMALPKGHFDGYNDGVIHRRVELGEFPIVRGENVLRVLIVGTNPQSVPKHMFGLDYLLVGD